MKAILNRQQMDQGSGLPKRPLFWPTYFVVVTGIATAGAVLAGGIWGTLLLSVAGIAAFVGLAWNSERLVPAVEGVWTGVGVATVAALLVAVSFYGQTLSYWIAGAAGLALIIALIYNPRAPSRFLLWVAGTEVEALRRASGGDERKAAGYNSQTIQGCVILITAIIAVFSMRMAATMLLPQWTWLLMPITWGAAILSFDRAMVKQLRPPNKSNGVNGWTLFPALLFRLLFAGMVSIVVSVPLELYVARSEIQTALVSRQLKELADKEDIVRDRYTKDLDQVKTSIEALNKEKEQYDTAVSSARQHLSDVTKTIEDRLMAEADPLRHVPISNDESRRWIKKPQYLAENSLTVAEENLSAFVPLYKERMANLLAEKKNLTGRQEADLKSVSKNASSESGFFEQYETYESLDREGTRALKLGLRIFFVFIEMLPIIVKILSIFSKPNYYEEELANYEEGESKHLHALLEPDRQIEATLRIADVRRSVDFSEETARLKQVEATRRAEEKRELDLLNQQSADDIERQRAISEESRREELSKLRQENYAAAAIRTIHHVLAIDDAINKGIAIALNEQSRAVKDVEDRYATALAAAIPNTPLDPTDLAEYYRRSQVSGELAAQRQSTIEAIVNQCNEAIRLLKSRADEEKRKISEE